MSESPDQLLPPPHLTQIFFDFDGTITQGDLLDDLVSGYSVHDAWKQVERQWLAGEIGSFQCLSVQFDGIRIVDSELTRVLNSIKLDTGFVSLVQWLEQLKVPQAVLSDGIDRFIHHALKAAGVEMPVRSNAIERRESEMKLVCPLSRSDCVSAAAHCKCFSMKSLHQPKRQTIYIGDGRSDLCPARQADFVFAKGNLAAALKSESRAFVPFQTLWDVKAFLEKNWG